jgi:radical SAM protein with 4Fe4S-binding SPASM domain
MIDEKIFCIAPWVNLYVNSDGTLRSCCWGQMEDLGNINNEYEDLWNNDKIKSFREKLINNVKMDNCRRCYYLESKSENAWSHRLELNDLYKEEYDKILINSSVESSIYPKRMDIQFSNLCNYECIMCSERFSSAIGKHIQRIADSETILNKIKNYLPDLEYITFAGGEPFLEDTHFKILEYCNENNITQNKTLHYNTNLSYIQQCKYDLESLWKNFKKIKIFGSIDGIGKRGEFIRKNSRWDIVLNNFKYISNLKCDNISLYVYSTISAYNIYDYTDMFNYFMDNNIVKYSMSCVPNILIHPEFMRVSHLPKSFKEICADKIFKYRERHLSHTYIHTEEQLLHMLLNENPLNSDNMMKELKEFTIQQCKNRNINNFFEIFPELESVLL